MEVKHGYKLTDAGVIPDEWEVKTIGMVFDIVTGKSKSAYVDLGGCFLICDMGSVSTDGRLIASKRTNYRGDFLLRGDLVMPKDDIGGGKIIGRVGYVVSRDTYVLGDHVYRLRAREGDPLFFSYLINSDPINMALRKKVVGTAQLGLGRKSVLEQGIPVPPLTEQRAIATALSDVDALLSELDRLVVKKRDLKRAAVQQLLTGQTRLPGFHGEWEVKRLGEAAAFYKGKGLPKSALSEHGAEPCVHYGELFTRYGATICTTVSRTDNAGASAFRSVANDVLMPTSDVTPTGLAKASCITSDGVVLGGDILVIRPDATSVFGSFLSYLIRYDEGQVLKLVTGSTVFHLYGANMKKFTFSMPPHPEQVAIATVLSDMDAELAAIEARRDKTRTLKQGMMQQLLTGKTRLVPPEVTRD